MQTEDTETTATFTANTEGATSYYVCIHESIWLQKCRGNASITVNAIPAAPTTTNFSKCLNDPTESLDNYVTAATGATLLWYSASLEEQETQTAPTPSTANAVTGDKYLCMQ